MLDGDTDDKGTDELSSFGEHAEVFKLKANGISAPSEFRLRRAARRAAKAHDSFREPLGQRRDEAEPPHSLVVIPSINKLHFTIVTDRERRKMPTFFRSAAN